MLDCERWTLTHSSGWADVLVELGLELAFGLALAPALWLWLAAKRAASDAEAVAEAVWDDDAEADGEPDDPEGDPDGELDPEGDPDGEPDFEAEPVGAGDAGVRLGLEVAAGELGELELELGELELEPEEDGVGVGVLDGFGVGVLVGVGVGVGVGVLEAGSTWQLVSVLRARRGTRTGRGRSERQRFRQRFARQARQHAQGKETATQQAECRYSYVLGTHENRHVSATRQGYFLLFSSSFVFGGNWVTDGHQHSYPM